MKITKVECIPISFPRRVPGVDAQKGVVGMPSLFVKIHTDEGIVGMGETGHIAADYIGSTQESNLGIIATKMLGQKLEWDGPAMRFTNSEEANRWINPPYRNGWSL